MIFFYYSACPAVGLMLMLIIVCSITTHAAANESSLVARGTEAQIYRKTIRAVAKLLNMNVIISPAVSGVAVVNFHHALPSEALNALLMAHGLSKSRMGNTWLIAPQSELIKIKHEELKWRDMHEEIAPLLTQVWQIKYAKAVDIARVLHDEGVSFLSKRGRVRVDARTKYDLCSEMLRSVCKIYAAFDSPRS